MSTTLACILFSHLDGLPIYVCQLSPLYYPGGKLFRANYFLHMPKFRCLAIVLSSPLSLYLCLPSLPGASCSNYFLHMPKFRCLYFVPLPGASWVAIVLCISPGAKLFQNFRWVANLNYFLRHLHTLGIPTLWWIFTTSRPTPLPIHHPIAIIYGHQALILQLSGARPNCHCTRDAIMFHLRLPTYILSISSPLPA